MLLILTSSIRNDFQFQHKDDNNKNDELFNEFFITYFDNFNIYLRFLFTLKTDNYFWPSLC